MSVLPATVRIREVGPRDGLQNEAPVGVADRVRLIAVLAAAGLREIEAVAFVSPAAVPAMAGAAEVLAALDRDVDVAYWALVPNLKGAELALEAGADALNVTISASPAYNQRNVGQSIEQSLAGLRVICSLAAGVVVDATVSCAFGSPYEGDIEPETVARLAASAREAGATTLTFADTTGMATPRGVREVVEALRAELPDVDINMHFHDTRGTGLANVVTALALGIDYFDTSIGGMGGSPFASGSTGNVATEDVVHMLTDMDIDTGVDLDKLLEAGRVAQSLIEGELPGKVLKAGPRWKVSG